MKSFFISAMGKSAMLVLMLGIGGLEQFARADEPAAPRKQVATAIPALQALEKDALLIAATPLKGLAPEDIKLVEIFRKATSGGNLDAVRLRDLNTDLETWIGVYCDPDGGHEVTPGGGASVISKETKPKEAVDAATQAKINEMTAQFIRDRTKGQAAEWDKIRSLFMSRVAPRSPLVKGLAAENRLEMIK